MLVERLLSTQSVVGSNHVWGSSFFLLRIIGVVFDIVAFVCLVSLTDGSCHCRMVHVILEGCNWTQSAHAGCPTPAPYLCVLSPQGNECLPPFPSPTMLPYNGPSLLLLAGQLIDRALSSRPWTMVPMAAGWLFDRVLSSRPWTMVLMTASCASEKTILPAFTTSWKGSPLGPPALLIHLAWYQLEQHNWCCKREWCLTAGCMALVYWLSSWLSESIAHVHYMKFVRICHSVYWPLGWPPCTSTLLS